MKEKCNCIYGYHERIGSRADHLDSTPELIKQSMTQVNYNDRITRFKFCPKCGKQLDFGVYLTNEQYMKLLWPKKKGKK